MRLNIIINVFLFCPRVQLSITIWSQSELLLDGFLRAAERIRPSEMNEWDVWMLWPWIITQQDFKKKPLCLFGASSSWLVCSHISICVFVVSAELEEEASRPGKNTKTLSSDLIDYVQHMIREHREDFKVRVGVFFLCCQLLLSVCLWRSSLSFCPKKEKKKNKFPPPQFFTHRAHHLSPSVPLRLPPDTI